MPDPIRTPYGLQRLPAGADSFDDGTIVLRPPMPLEIKYVTPVAVGQRHIAYIVDDFIVFGKRLDGDFAGGRHDARAADHMDAFFYAGLGRGGDPAGVLVGRGLQRKMVVMSRQVPWLAQAPVSGGRVVTHHDQVHGLQAHDPVSLGPAAIVADAHADTHVARVEYRKAQVAHLEVLLLQVLYGIAVLRLRIARNVDLAILADDGAVAVHQNAGVELAIAIEFGVAQVEPDTQRARQVEQRPGFLARHLGFEEPAYLLRIVHLPARKKRGQRQLGESHPPGAAAGGVLEQVAQARNRLRARVRALDGAHLGHGDMHLHL